MKKTVLIFALIATSAIGADAPKTTYVGQGRWVCSGSTAACAQVDANNRNEAARRDYDYQRQQDRAQESIDKQRREEEARRYKRY